MKEVRDKTVLVAHMGMHQLDLGDPPVNLYHAMAQDMVYR